MQFVCVGGRWAREPKDGYPLAFRSAVSGDGI